MKQFYLYYFCILLSPLGTYSYERPIVVVVPSYNNQEWCQKNLDSVFCQHYTNYRIIYVDDCSQDATYTIVRAHTAEHHQEHRMLIIHNSVRVGALANHYKAVWLCEDNEIVVQLDGDDCLAHPDVLATINNAYDNPTIWLTYGQYETDPPGIPSCASKPLPYKIIKKNAYREYPWITSAPRTFYVWLFKKIRLDSLLYHSIFFKTTCDLAFMFPMLEMAAGHIYCMQDILYIYNCKTPYNDYKVHLQAQRHAEFVIRAQKKYKPCIRASSNTVTDYTCGCLIVSDDNSSELAECLTCLKQHISHLDACTVLSTYDASNAAAYQALEKEYADVTFLTATIRNFKDVCLKALKSMNTSYILLASAGSRSTQMLDIHRCTRMLVQTQAHGFYLSLGSDVLHNPLLEHEQKIPPHTALDDSIHAWQFYTGEYTWREPNTFCMAIYRTEDVLRACTQGKFSTPYTLQEVWRQYPVDLISVGLFFEHSVAHNRS